MMSIIEKIIEQHGADSTTVQVLQQFFPIIEQAEAALQSQKPEPNDLMLSGVLRMPFDMAMATEISRVQFYHRAQQALNDLEALQSQDRADAERYRWLRDCTDDQIYAMTKGGYLMGDKELDEAIDAAMEQQT